MWPKRLIQVGFIRYIVEVDNEKTTWKTWNWDIHRENDLPAIEYNNGDKIWYKNGVKHREGKPAVIFADGHQEWWFKGELHREDGPAIIRKSGRSIYFIKGKEQTKKHFLHHFKKK